MSRNATLGACRERKDFAQRSHGIVVDANDGARQLSLGSLGQRKCDRSGQLAQLRLRALQAGVQLIGLDITDQFALLPRAEGSSRPCRCHGPQNSASANLAHQRPSGWFLRVETRVDPPADSSAAGVADGSAE